MPPVIQPAVVTASWTLERENILIDAILHELSENGRPNDGSNFKAVAWNRIANAFAAKAFVGYNKQQLQSKYASFKDKFIIWDNISKQSGLFQ
jgi:hypothetical protein